MDNDGEDKPIQRTLAIIVPLLLAFLMSWAFVGGIDWLLQRSRTKPVDPGAEQFSSSPAAKEGRELASVEPPFLDPDSNFTDTKTEERTDQHVANPENQRTFVWFDPNPRKRRGFFFSSPAAEEGAEKLNPERLVTSIGAASPPDLASSSSETSGTSSSGSASITASTEFPTPSSSPAAFESTSGGIMSVHTAGGYKVNVSIGPKLSTTRATTGSGYQVSLGLQGQVAGP